MKKFLYWLGGYNAEIAKKISGNPLIAPGMSIVLVFIISLWGGFCIGNMIYDSYICVSIFAIVFAFLVCLVDILILRGDKSKIMWFSRFVLSLLISIIVGTLTIMQIFDDEILSQKQSLISEQVETELGEIVVKIKTCEEAIAQADSLASSYYSLHKDTHAGNTSRSGDTMNVYPCAIRQDQTPGVDCSSASLCRSYYDKCQEQRGKKQEKENELAELKAEKSDLEKRTFAKAESMYGKGVLPEVQILVNLLNNSGIVAWIVVVLIWLIVFIFNITVLLTKISVESAEKKYNELMNLTRE